MARLLDRESVPSLQLIHANLSGSDQLVHLAVEVPPDLNGNPRVVADAGNYAPGTSTVSTVVSPAAHAMSARTGAVSFRLQHGEGVAIEITAADAANPPRSMEVVVSLWV
ncbi:MAG: hypothetical protein GKS06_15835 [Acidobacteria bacterium]|nr:hypothetical protein [Acidobacteriota bacterium]